MKKNLSTILAAVSCLLVVVCLFQISDLKQQVGNLQGNLSNQISSISNNVSSIYSNVSSMLEEQANLLSSGSWEFTEADIDNLTAEVICSVVPKEYTSATEAVIVIDDIEHPMTLSSGSFVSKIRIPLLDDSHASQVIFREGDIVRTEALDWYLSARYDYLPNVYADYDHSATGSPRDGVYTYDCEGVINIHVDCKQPNEVKAITLVEMLNGETLGRTNIPLDNAEFYANYRAGNGAPEPEMPAMQIGGSSQAGPFHYELNKKYEIPYGGTLTIYVEVEDGNGLFYRSIIAHEEISSSGEPLDEHDWWRGMETSIYDANGNALFNPYPSLY